MATHANQRHAEMPENFDYVSSCRGCRGLGAYWLNDPDCPQCKGSGKTYRRTTNDRSLSVYVGPAPADAKLGRVSSPPPNN